MVDRSVLPVVARPEWAAPRREAFSWFLPSLAALLAGYLFFSKPFAYLHVPGTPVFVAELVLAVGVLDALRVRSPWRRLLRVCPSLVLALGFAVVCACRLAYDLPAYGLDAVRDSAIWYYSAFAFLVSAVVVRRPSAVPFLAGWYRRAIPVFLLWAPVAVVLANWPGAAGVTVPGTSLPANGFKPGDLAVSTAMAVAFLWLAPDRVNGAAPGRKAAVVWLSCVGIVALLVCGTQTRGGLLAGLVTLFVAAVCLPGGRQRRLLASVGGALLTVLLVIMVLDVRITGLHRERDVSLDQIARNVVSVADRGGNRGDLDGTVEWRDRLWSRARDDLQASGAWLTGFGFGPVLGFRYGVSHHDSPRPLRNVHNSHLTILVRAGAVAAGLWVLMWLAWAAALVRLMRRTPAGVRDPVVALGAWLLASAAGALVNAYFDPALEGPQAAVWLYVVFGLGAVVARHRPAAQRAAGPA